LNTPARRLARLSPRAYRTAKGKTIAVKVVYVYLFFLYVQLLLNGNHNTCSIALTSPCSKLKNSINR